MLALELHSNNIYSVFHTESRAEGGSIFYLDLGERVGAFDKDEIQIIFSDDLGAMAVKTFADFPRNCASCAYTVASSAVKVWPVKFETVCNAVEDFLAKNPYTPSTECVA